MSDTVRLPRNVRGKRPEFFATPGVDEAMSMILVLAQELAVLRDANWTLSPDGLPLEGFVRDIVRNRTEMYGWFRVAGSRVECEAWVAASGRLSKSVEAPGPAEHLGLHSIVADCLVGEHRGPTAPGVSRRSISGSAGAIRCRSIRISGFARISCRCACSVPRAR